MEIKKIEYGAYLSYDLYGGGEENLKSRNICIQIKNKNVETIESIINEMKIGYDSLKFKKFFDSDTCLIPIPGSSKHSNSTSVAKHIADVMVKYGFCKNVINCIKRVSESKNFLNFNESYPIFISFIIDSIVSTFLFFNTNISRFEIFFSTTIDHKIDMPHTQFFLFPYYTFEHICTISRSYKISNMSLGLESDNGADPCRVEWFLHQK